MKILPVQYGPPRSAKLTASYGKKMGQAAADYAAWLGFHKGEHLWCDLEGTAARKAKKSGCTAYLTAWAKAVTDAGYACGVYIGDPDVPVKSQELGAIPNVTSFWASASWYEVKNPPLPRGWSVRQSGQMSLVGMNVDPDVIFADKFGTIPTLVASI